MSGGKRAVLIGVRTNPNIPEEFGRPLDGCHADVEAMWTLLRSRGFAEPRVLIDVLEDCPCRFCRDPASVAGASTRREIREQVARLASEAAGDDVIVLYYSGHGSEFSGVGVSAGQRFQTLVPHDSGRGPNPNFDITDREISLWIERFNRKTRNVTLIFDSCYSGGVTDVRSGSQPTGEVRRVSGDSGDPATLFEGVSGVASEEEKRGASGWIWRPGRTAIVLSASSAKELSSETRVDGRPRGLFTHALLGVLGESPDAARWSDVFAEVCERVTAENLSQHPRREGDGPILEAGEIDPSDIYPPDVVELKRFAVVIGIDYQARGEDDAGASRRFPALRTPAVDAAEVARVLGDPRLQDYELVGLSRRKPEPLLNAQATRKNIHRLIQRLARLKVRSYPDSSVVIYFACHGVTRSNDAGEPVGYVIPWDADRDDPSTWLPMKDLRDQLVDGIDDAERLAAMGQSSALDRMRCRHLFLVLDCCFGGALSYDFFRGSLPERPIYYSEYKRYVEGTAWRLLTSASATQQALDRDPRDPAKKHSPFAAALLEGLCSDRADALRIGGRSDHLITAAELHAFVDARLREMAGSIQTPGLMDLRPNRGEVVFRVPGFAPSPVPDPPLDAAADPWWGERPYAAVRRVGERDEDPLFFGRDEAMFSLLEHFVGRRAVVVVGPSGSGKTSLVEAGFLPLVFDPLGGRRRARSALERLGLTHYLISADDLAAVRGWLADPAIAADGLDAFEPDVLADRVRSWARQRGLDAAAAEGIDARARMRQVGAQVFLDQVSGDELGWFARLDLPELMQYPRELHARLRFWSRPDDRTTLVDLLSVPDRVLVDQVGVWSVVRSTEQARQSPAERILLVVDPLAAGEGEGETVELGTLLAEKEGVRILATAREVPETISGGPEWVVFRMPSPSRDALREIVEGPASARVLFFEPPRAVDEIVEQVADLAAPLAALSPLLSATYGRAMARRAATCELDDRRLSALDLPEGGALGLAAARGDAFLAELDGDGPGLAQWLLLRLYGPEEHGASRRVHRGELEPIAALQGAALREIVLPGLTEAGVVLQGDGHVEIAAADLFDRWATLREWIAAADDLPAVRSAGRRAREWLASGQDPRKLLGGDPSVHRLRGSELLNRLEHEFVEAGLRRHKMRLAKAFADTAQHDVHGAFSRAALLAATSARLVLEVGGDFRSDAEQALRDVLERTPLSIPLRVPGRVVGLSFSADRRYILARTEEDGAFSWDLDAVEVDGLRGPRPVEASSAEGPAPGDGLATTAEGERGALLRADGGGAARIDCAGLPRYFPDEGLPLPVQSRWLGEPLLGLPAPARFLIFSPPITEGLPPRRRVEWLAAAAVVEPPRKREIRAESADPDARRSPPVHSEIRLWRLRDRRPNSMPAEPTVLYAWGDRPLPIDPPLVAIAFLADGRLVGVLGNGKPRRWSWWGEAKGSTATPWPSDEATVLIRGGRAWWLFAERARGGPRSETVVRLQTVDGPTVELTPPGGWMPDALSADGAWVLLRRGDDAAMLLWDASRRDAKPHRLELPGAPRRAVFSPDGRWLTVITADGDALLWELAPGAAPRPLDGAPPENILLAAFGPDGRVAFAARSGEIRIHDLRRGDVELHPSPPLRFSALAWSDDGRYLAAGAGGGAVWLWTLGREARPDEPVRAVLLTTGVRGGALGTLVDGELEVRDLAFDRSGRFLAVAREIDEPPYFGRVDIHRLDLGELAEVARRVAGRRLSLREVPPPLRRDLAGEDRSALDLIEGPPDRDKMARHPPTRFAKGETS